MVLRSGSATVNAVAATLRAVTVAGCLLGLAGAAPAAAAVVVTQTQNFTATGSTGATFTSSDPGFGLAQGSAAMAFAGFDLAAYGPGASVNLTVKVELVSTIAFQAGVSVGGFGGFSPSSPSQRYEINGPGGQALLDLPTGYTFACVSSRDVPACIYSIEETLTFDGSRTLADGTDFIDVPVELTAEFAFTVGGFPLDGDINDPALFGRFADVTWSGSVTLTYTAEVTVGDPGTEVPAPAGAGLFLAGFAVLAVLRRRG